MSPIRIAAAVAAALLLAGAVFRRRQGRGRAALILLAAALALGVYAAGLLDLLPDPERAIEDVATTLGPYTYVLVGVLAFAESGAFIGFVAPGEVTVILGGVIAGQGEIDIVPLVGLVWACSFAGDSTSFFIGRRFGRRVLVRFGPRVGVTAQRLEHVETYFEEHGGATVMLGRFIGVLRPLAPAVAGSSGMTFRRFLPFSVVGTGLWSATFCLLGYIFYRSFSQVTAVAGRASLVFAVLVGTVVGGVFAYRRLRREEERRRLAAWFERQGRRPLLRPFAAVTRPLWGRAVMPAYRAIAPRARFLGRRLTPGDLGIEFTTTLAGALVGAYVVGVLASLVDDDPGPAFADGQAFRIADGLFNTTVIDVAQVVTHLGSLPAAVAAVLLTALLYVRRRGRSELMVLAAGLAAVWLAVNLMKAGFDRPRPAAQITDAEGSSFPSGHAAYSTVYVAVAVAVRRVLPGLATRAGLVFAALALTTTIGLTRVYLRVHFWTDVAAGWALGAAIFGTLATILLVVSYARQTRRSHQTGGTPESA